jgi:hypothetical protein
LIHSDDARVRYLEVRKIEEQKMINRIKILGCSVLLAMTFGLVDTVLAGGGGGGSKNANKLLSNGEIAEIAANPSLLASRTRGKNDRVKVDAVARVLDRIADAEGVDSPKILEILTLAFENMKLSPEQVGRNMASSSYKNEVLLLIDGRFGSEMAQAYQRGSGATFPIAPPPPPPPPVDNEPRQQQDQGQQQQQQQVQTTPPPPPIAPVYPGQGLQ